MMNSVVASGATWIRIALPQPGNEWTQGNFKMCIRDRNSDVVEGARWDIVPRSAVESRIRFRWRNYTEALATIGGDPGEPGSTAAMNLSLIHIFH